MNKPPVRLVRERHLFAVGRARGSSGHVWNPVTGEPMLWKAGARLMRAAAPIWERCAARSVWKRPKAGGEGTSRRVEARSASPRVGASRDQAARHGTALRSGPSMRADFAVPAVRGKAWSNYVRRGFGCAEQVLAGYGPLTLEIRRLLWLGRAILSSNRFENLLIISQNLRRMEG